MGDRYKEQAKALVKRLTQGRHGQSTRLTLESGGYCFHYMIEGGVVFLTMADRGYPKKLAYQYLDELQKEFTSLYASEVEKISRPYAFIKFDRFIQKTRKLYLDTRTQRNLEKLSEELSEVHSIMTRNIQEVLGQGGEARERVEDVLHFDRGVEEVRQASGAAQPAGAHKKVHACCGDRPGHPGGPIRPGADPVTRCARVWHPATDSFNTIQRPRGKGSL